MMNGGRHMNAAHKLLVLGTVCIFTFYVSVSTASDKLNTSIPHSPLDTQKQVLHQNLYALQHQLLQYVVNHQQQTVSIISAGDNLSKFLLQQLQSEVLNQLVVVALDHSNYCFDSREKAT